MIFVTVGSELPFDRMTRAVDAWVGRTGRTDVVAQIGRTDFVPQHMAWTATLDPAEYRDHCWNASAIIGHAGMGTILTALELARPLVIVPRKACHRETRNDHQVETARRFGATTHVVAAADEIALDPILDRIDTLPTPQQISSFASLPLLNAVRDFVRGDATVERPSDVENIPFRTALDLSPDHVIAARTDNADEKVPIRRAA